MADMATEFAEAKSTRYQYPYVDMDIVLSKTKKKIQKQIMI